MDAQTIIALGSLIVGVIGVFWGVKKVKSNKQKQITKSGTGIQSGRDTNVKF